VPRGASRHLVVALLAVCGAVALAACGSSGGSGSGGGSGGGDQFTSAAFQRTLDQVKLDTGEDTELLEVQITSAGTDYKIRAGEKASGLHFDPGSSDSQDVQVNVIGTGSLADSAFPISDVDPAAIDRMVNGAPAASGADDFKVTVMTLGKSFTPDVMWTINGEASGRTGLVLMADPDGSNLTSPTGAVPSGATGSTTGTTAAPSGVDPQAITECIQKAGGDVNKIQACATQ
jgi:hypothetical protein